MLCKYPSNWKRTPKKMLCSMSSPIYGIIWRNERVGRDNDGWWWGDEQMGWIWAWERWPARSLTYRRRIRPAMIPRVVRGGGGGRMRDGRGEFDASTMARSKSRRSADSWMVWRGGGMKLWWCAALQWMSVAIVHCKPQSVRDLVSEWAGAARNQTRAKKKIGGIFGMYYEFLHGCL